MISRRSFLKRASGSLFAASVSSRLLGAEQGSQPLEEFSYGAVKLAPGLPRSQFEQTQAVMLRMNVDSLLKPFRLRAGLPAPGPEMGGWYDEAPWSNWSNGGHGFAPGHSFGQWISALARGCAATGDPANRKKIQELLDQYEPTISGRFYTNFRFPAYVYDKLVCGLMDAHEFCDFDRNWSLLNRTTDAAEPHLPPRALDRDQVQLAWRKSIGDNTTPDYGWDEPYTLPENLYLAWHRGAGDRYKALGSRFLLDETYFDPLAARNNVLAGHHAYSFCNAMSSAMQAYLSEGSEKHLLAARNGLQMIEAQSFATGGWGPDESFRAPESDDIYKSLSETHSSFETPCGSYAHFKLTRYLLRVTRDGHYGDSMERVLYNTVLGAKPLQDDGRAFYYSDYNFSGKKVYHGDHWPCCAGALTQATADYHILIYFRDDRGVYVNLYLPSELSWTTNDGAQCKLTQDGEYPFEGQVRFRLSASRRAAFPLRLRIPEWSQTGEGRPEIRVNGRPVPLRLSAGFATIERKWHDGDHIELDLPMPIRLVPVSERHPNTAALMYGPLVLFALGENTNAARAQLLQVKRTPGADWQAGSLRFKPFFAIEDEPYTTYLNVS